MRARRWRRGAASAARRRRPGRASGRVCAAARRRPLVLVQGLAAAATTFAKQGLPLISRLLGTGRAPARGTFYRAPRHLLEALHANGCRSGSVFMQFKPIALSELKPVLIWQMNLIRPMRGFCIPRSLCRPGEVQKNTQSSGRRTFHSGAFLACEACHSSSAVARRFTRF